MLSGRFLCSDSSDAESTEPCSPPSRYDFLHNPTHTTVSEDLDWLEDTGPKKIHCTSAKLHNQQTAHASAPRITRSSLECYLDYVPIFHATAVAPLSTTTVECYRLVPQHQIRGRREWCIQFIKQHNLDGAWREYLKSKLLAGKRGVNPADHASPTLRFLLRKE